MQAIRKTKIICTLGPATDDPGILGEMIEAGMNVARLNFSHGSHEEHKRRADMVKELREKLQKPVAIMIDTKGPDIRVGRFRENFIELQSGRQFTLTTEQIMGDEERVYVTYPDLPLKVREGDAILLDDGLMRLIVLQTTDTDVFCRVITGGILANNKSVNVPGIHMDIPYMREKDIDDINFAIENGFDFIAASFVRGAADVLLIKKLLQERNAGDIRIIAKIENSEGIANIDEILDISDGIMVARGDMGVEIDFQELPSIQKALIKKAGQAGKVSITATQMLESMIKNPRPTRAEITDIANAIYDGSGAIMLSGETAVGRHPLLTLQTMVSIAERTEKDIDYKRRFELLAYRHAGSITDAIGYAVCSLAYGVGAEVIITPTRSGYTANMVSRYRPIAPIIAGTPYIKVFYQLALSWGVTPILQDAFTSRDNAYECSRAAALKMSLAKKGDMAVVTSGMSPEITADTNAILVGVL